VEKGLLEKTGKSLAEWITLVQKQRLEKHGEIMKYLKGECGVTHGYANFVAHKTKEAETGPSSDEDLVTAQYAKKQDLVPIYEKLIAEITKLGDDVEVAPKKTTVSLRRAKQFALIKPATKTRSPNSETADRRCNEIGRASCRERV